MRPSLPTCPERNSAQLLMQFGPLEIDEIAREVRVLGQAIQLKPREFSLLVALASNAGVAMSRERLLDLVWGYDFEGGDRTLDVHIRRLRMKIEEDVKCGPFLHTLRRFGYKFSFNVERNPRFTELARRSDKALTLADASRAPAGI
jgi:two-component system alkaline phosphatase synthesis response regulator PhoP